MKVTRQTSPKHPKLRSYQFQLDTSRLETQRISAVDVQHLETQHIAAVDVQYLETQHIAAVDVQHLETQRIASVDGFKLQETPPENMAAFSIRSEAIGANQLFHRNVPLAIPSPKSPLYRDDVAHASTTSLTIPQEISPQAASKQQKSIANTSKSKKKKRLNFALRVTFTTALFALLLRSISLPTLINALAHVHRPMLLVGLSIGTLGVVVSSYQWRILLHGEKIHLDLADLINLYLVGTAFSHFLPTGMGGDAVKAVYVGSESGKNDSSASAVIMSRVTGFFGMIFVASIVLFIEFHHFASTVVVWFLLLSLLVGIMICGAVFSVTLLGKLFKEKWAKYRFLASVTRIGNALNRSARQPHYMVAATVVGVVFWMIACLNYYVYGIAIDIHIPMYFYYVAIPLISLITFLPISINGFGVRESALVYIFSTVHVSSSTALLLALLMDGQVLFFGIVGACLYLTMDSKKKIKNGAIQTVQGGQK